MTTSVKNKAWHYDTLSRYLHWTVAFFIIGMLSVGIFMVYIADGSNNAVYFSLHKSFGVITGVMILIRILWRLQHKPAPLPGSVAAWQAKLANLMHFMLYACIMIMPLTGYFGSSFGKHGVALFGWPLPQWVTQNPKISEQLFDIHGVVAWILVTLIALHVLAAFKHLIVDKDGVFQRMWG